MVRRRGSASSQVQAQHGAGDVFSEQTAFRSDGADPAVAQVPGPTMSPAFTRSAGEAVADAMSRIGKAEGTSVDVPTASTATEDEPAPLLAGSLAAFGLADILFLLAGVTHTGELRVSGDSMDGLVWFDHGELAGAEAGSTATVADAIFQLACMESGWFSFSPGPLPPTSGPNIAVATVVDEVRPRLEEWKELEAAVPLDAVAALRPEPPGGDVQLRAAQWPLLAAIGKGGQTVESVLDVVDLDLIGGLRAIRELHAVGLVDLIAPPSSSPADGLESRGLTPDPELTPVVELTPVEGFAPIEELPPPVDPTLQPSPAADVDQFELADQSEVPLGSDWATEDAVGDELPTDLAEVTVMPPPIADDPWMRVGTVRGADEDGGVA